MEIDTQCSYWKTFKYVQNNLDMGSYILNYKFYEI